MEITLAEALLRRKELQGKVNIALSIKEKNIFEVKTQRRAVHEGIDDVVAQVPKLELNQVTAEHDWYAKNLRLIDALIQQANWTTKLDANESVMQDYVDKS